MILPHDRPRVLAIGAHPDDIELGAGGFIHCLTRESQATVNSLILTAGLQGPAQGEVYVVAQRRAEALRAAKLLGVPPENVEVASFEDCRLHEFGHQIIRHIESRLFGADGLPRFDMVLTHAGNDTHADHRAVHESTLSAVRDFRGDVVLYQAPSTKPNGFRPTFFVKLDEEAVRQKDLAIMAHMSQRGKVFSRASRTIGLAANWSLFLRLPEGTYLEAFEVYKSFF